MESINDDYAHRIKLDDGQKLNLWRRISFYWKEEPADDILSVILQRPDGSESKWSLLQFILIYPKSIHYRVLSHNHSIAFYGKQACR